MWFSICPCLSLQISPPWLRLICRVYWAKKHLQHGRPLPQAALNQIIQRVNGINLLYMQRGMILYRETHIYHLEGSWVSKYNTFPKLNLVIFFCETVTLQVLIVQVDPVAHVFVCPSRVRQSPWASKHSYPTFHPFQAMGLRGLGHWSALGKKHPVLQTEKWWKSEDVLERNQLSFMSLEALTCSGFPR